MSLTIDDALLLVYRFPRLRGDEPYYTGPREITV